MAANVFHEVQVQKLSLFENLSIVIFEFGQVRNSWMFGGLATNFFNCFLLLLAKGGQIMVSFFTPEPRIVLPMGWWNTILPPSNRKIVKLERLFGINVLKQRTNPKFSKKKHHDPKWLQKIVLLLQGPEPARVVAGAATKKTTGAFFDMCLAGVPWSESFGIALPKLLFLICPEKMKDRNYV